MGNQIYLSDKEIELLYDTASEWCSIMSDGDDTADLAEKRLKNGLGSAMYKLSSGTEAKEIYKDYMKR